jgi:hypothetical protein
MKMRSITQGIESPADADNCGSGDPHSMKDDKDDEDDEDNDALSNQIQKEEK